mmetsp:Transcript_10646/g.28422  ORF Transcript_10646/g.28422 Transcript_10646/m.28422 type:complete len:188 (+) Transcript_10646:328-891(+)
MKRPPSSELGSPVRVRKVPSVVASSVHIALYRDVKNAEVVCDAVRAQRVPGAVVNAKVVVSTTAVRQAAFRALSRERGGRMASRSVYTELIRELAAEKNVGKALKRFGVSNSCNAIMFVLLNDDVCNSSLAEINDLVEGLVVCDVDAQLEAIIDADAIKSLYSVDPKELLIGSLEDAVVSRIASSDI